MILHTNNQIDISPDLALQLLKDGNERFCNNLRFNHNYLQQVKVTASRQSPYAAVLSCMDSWAPVELILDQGIGAIFSIRIAGNVISDNILGSLEYAVAVGRSKLVVVMGHSNCGAIKGACDNIKIGKLTTLLHQIKMAVLKEHHLLENNDGSDPDFIRKITVLNVYNSITQILRQSRIIKQAFDFGQIMLVPALYDVATGKVDFMPLKDAYKHEEYR